MYFFFLATLIAVQEKREREREKTFVKSDLKINISSKPRVRSWLLSTNRSRLHGLLAFKIVLLS